MLNPVLIGSFVCMTWINPHATPPTPPETKCGLVTEWKDHEVVLVPAPRAFVEREKKIQQEIDQNMRKTEKKPVK